MEDAETNLLIYLKETFKKLMQNDNFEEWVDYHAGFGKVSAILFHHGATEHDNIKLG